MAGLWTLVLFIAGAGAARAQVKHNDYTQLSTSLTSTAPKIISIDEASQYGASTSGPGLGTNSGWSGRTPDLNQTLLDQKVIMGKFNTTYSTLNGHMSSDPLWSGVFNKGDDKEHEMFQATDTRRPLMSGDLQKDSSLNDFTADNQLERPGGVSKYEDAYTFHVRDGSDPVEQIGHELSMQDMNRYQFHSSNSSDPGLPTTRAAGNSQEPTFSGAGVLSDLPSLFSFNNEKPTTVSQLHTGGEVAPNVITPQGTFKYQPQGDAPFGPRPSIAPSNQNTASSPAVSLGHSAPIADQPRIPNLADAANEFHPAPRDGAETKVQYGTRHVWVQDQDPITYDTRIRDVDLPAPTN